MNECYAACDILIVGHYVDRRLRDYALPKKLLDAMGYKIPVIVGPYDTRKKIVERYNCGLVSDNSESIVFAIVVVPPAVVPSPTYNCLVSVTYISSPTKGVMPNRSALVPRLTCKAIY